MKLKCLWKAPVTFFIVFPLMILWILVGGGVGFILTLPWLALFVSGCVDEDSDPPFMFVGWVLETVLEWWRDV